jgi:hypothetical protein
MAAAENKQKEFPLLISSVKVQYSNGFYAAFRLVLGIKRRKERRKEFL